MSGTKSSPGMAERWRQQKMQKAQARTNKRATMAQLKRAMSRRLIALREGKRKIRDKKVKGKAKRAEVRAEVKAEIHPFTTMVSKLSNWQRNQWARDGYPGLRGADSAKVEPYTLLMRHAAAKKVFEDVA